MLNYIWGGMIIIGIIYGSFTGQMAEVTNAAISSAKEAVSLCITMLGVMAFWMGMMEIAEDTGIMKKLTKKMNPIVEFLFPNIPQNNEAKNYISINMAANILGLGWAATPAGLRAMEEMQKLNIEKNGQKKSYIASSEMCTFLVINISSLQLIPVNMIAYRSQYGSVNPTAVIGPGLIATLISTAVGVVFSKVCCRFKP